MAFSYGIRHNRCAGIYVAVAYNRDTGETSGSAQKHSAAEAREAIRHHYSAGVWPSDVQEQVVEVCDSCGRPLNQF